MPELHVFESLQSSRTRNYLFTGFGGSCFSRGRSWLCLVRLIFELLLASIAFADAEAGCGGGGSGGGAIAAVESRDIFSSIPNCSV